MKIATGKKGPEADRTRAGKEMVRLRPLFTGGHLVDVFTGAEPDALVAGGGRKRYGGVVRLLVV